MSEHKKAASTAGGSDKSGVGIVVAQGLPTRKRWVLTGAVVVLVAGVLAVAYLNGPGKRVVQAPATPQQKFQATYGDVQKLSGQANYAESAKTIEAYLAANPATTPQANDYHKQLTVLAGTAYLSQKSYPKALEYYQQSLALSTEPFDKMSAMHGIAMTYERSGDNAKAIAEYKAIIEIARPLSASNQQAARFIIRDERAIKNLGGQL